MYYNKYNGLDQNYFNSLKKLKKYDLIHYLFIT
jgi:hypothetical protein